MVPDAYRCIRHVEVRPEPPHPVHTPLKAAANLFAAKHAQRSRRGEAYEGSVLSNSVAEEVVVSELAQLRRHRIDFADGASAHLAEPHHPYPDVSLVRVDRELFGLPAVKRLDLRVLAKKPLGDLLEILVREFSQGGRAEETRPDQPAHLAPGRAHEPIVPEGGRVRASLGLALRAVPEIAVLLRL